MSPDVATYPFFGVEFVLLNYWLCIPCLVLMGHMSPNLSLPILMSPFLHVIVHVDSERKNHLLLLLGPEG